MTTQQLTNTWNRMRENVTLMSILATVAERPWVALYFAAYMQNAVEHADSATQEEITAWFRQHMVVPSQ